MKFARVGTADRAVTRRVLASVALAGVVVLGALGAQIGAAGAQEESPDPGIPVTTTTQGRVTAQAGPISGHVVSNETHQAMPGICVVFFDTMSQALDGWAITDGGGSFGFTPANDDAQNLVVFGPSIPGDCTSTPLSSGPVPEWFADRPVDVEDPFHPPVDAAPVVGPADIGVCLGDREIAGNCDEDNQPSGPGSISGKVVAAGDSPVVQACVFVLSEDHAVYGSMTDTTGAYLVKGLPLTTNYVVGFVPPFDTGDGPCNSEGPPPVSGVGALQPEWYSNQWIDLASPGLDGDPYAVATGSGANVVTADAAGIDGCLTTDLPSVTPRPACVSAESVAAAQAAPADGSATTSLPKTGTDATTTELVAGVALVVAGGLLLALTRRRLSRHAS